MLASQQHLTPAQQYLLESIGIDPDGQGPARPVARSQADRWALASPPPAGSTPARATCGQHEKHVEIVGGEEIRLGS